jgi:hypothetical protein
MSAGWLQTAPPPHLTNVGFHVVRVVLGLFLLVAAGLKTHGLALDPVDPDSFFASPRLILATVEIEVLLSLWLLSGWSPRAAWVAALGFFGILSCVSLYSALIGQESCGCFGRVPVNPWFTFGLDVLAVSAFAVWRAPKAPNASVWTWFMGFLKAGAGAGALLVVGCALLLPWFGSSDEALARFRGEAISVEPALTQLGEGEQGEQRAFSIQLINHTDQSVQVLGGTTACACIATRDLPITIAPHDRQSIEVRIKFTGSAGAFQRHFTLITDENNQRTIVARFSGQLRKSAE